MANEKLGPPADISSALGKAKDRINLIGMELEGGWVKVPDPRVKIVRDGSVNLQLHPLAPQLGSVGELNSPPMERKELPKWLQVYYPSAHNDTCGMHVHISMKTAFSYQRLMVNKPFSYPATVIAFMILWAKEKKFPKAHPIWARLDGKNEFCQHCFQADEQAKTSGKDYDHHRQGHRYTVISYCWSRYRTFECRLLPMMDTPALALEAVERLADITNAFLAVTAGREPRVSVKVKQAEVEVVEEKKVFV